MTPLAYGILGAVALFAGYEVFHKPRPKPRPLPAPTPAAAPLHPAVAAAAAKYGAAVAADPFAPLPGQESLSGNVHFDVSAGPSTYSASWENAPAANYGTNDSSDWYSQAVTNVADSWG